MSVGIKSRKLADYLNAVIPQYHVRLQLPLVPSASEAGSLLVHTTLSPSSVLASPTTILELGTEHRSSLSPGSATLFNSVPTISVSQVKSEEKDRRQNISTGIESVNAEATGPLTSLTDRIKSWLLHLIHFISRKGSNSPPVSESSLSRAGVEHVSVPWELARSSCADGDHILHDIPDYVLEHAPLVHLFSGEKFWPCDMDEHLMHITPYLNYTPISASWQHPSLTNLDTLNHWQHGHHVFLTSNDNVERRPEWLLGRKNIPTPVSSFSPLPQNQSPGFEKAFENFRRSNRLKNKDRKEGRSSAPAVLIVVDKGDGIVDAFWFYFYSYNLGNKVLNLRFGNHVGDWEHSLVRFHYGIPKAVYLSEHAGGTAYSYEAVEKMGKRPVIYSATGTHAMYAIPGTHSYILPWGLLHDKTDAGPLWDPSLNMHAYTYSIHNDTLTPSTMTAESPTEWFYFRGHWGDMIYPLNDRRQYEFAYQCHYVSGPLGPRFKNLARRKVCQAPEEDICVIRGEIGLKGSQEVIAVGRQRG